MIYKSIKHIVICICIFVISSYIWIAGDYGYYSVCSQCGIEKNTHEKQIPYTHITYAYFQHIEDTPLSKLITKHQLADQHEHQWLFGSGRGNSILCAIGNGRNSYRNACDPMVLSFMDHLAKLNKNKAKKWIKIILHPKIADEMHLILTDFPVEKEITDEEFCNWWQQTLCEEDSLLEYTLLYLPEELKNLTKEASTSLYSHD